MVCARKGYPFVCVMAESFSIERRKLMRFLGARVVLTNPAHKGTGMVIKAKELADKHGWFFPNQFDNEANAWIHEMTTGTLLRETLLCKLLYDFIFNTLVTVGRQGLKSSMRLKMQTSNLITLSWRMDREEPLKELPKCYESALLIPRFMFVSPTTHQ
jgi:threonine dehydratase